jgi:hypothetical protein
VLGPGRHLPVPFWVTAAVIGRDILIITVAGAIYIMTGFRGFRPSWLGKASTFVQVIAVILILVAAVFPQIQGRYLPIVYTTVALFAVVSGIHYIFFVARLMREAEPAEVAESDEKCRRAFDSRLLRAGFYISRHSSLRSSTVHCQISLGQAHIGHATVHH